MMSVPHILTIDPAFDVEEVASRLKEKGISVLGVLNTLRLIKADGDVEVITAVPGVKAIEKDGEVSIY